MTTAFPPGTRFGRYEIRSQLGVGGMGEVYLAEDTKLNRAVALKFLPLEVASDQKRMQRFNQEAHAISALNHPNIITIYEIEQDAPVPYITTEYIEGVTLRDRMAQGRMRIDEALEVAIQTASALAAAHAKEIVHRDIKPENIMLREDGYVKILDFGLAKLMETEATSPEAVTQVHTDIGAVIGTARYMSPEQARGLEIDERTDIFSLGIVLYEMLAGKSPFTGTTNHVVVASILKEEPPPLTAFTPDAPARLQEVVSRALRKDRDERYQTARELLDDLKALKQDFEFELKLARGRETGASGENREITSTDQFARVTASEPMARPTLSALLKASDLKRRKSLTLISVVALSLALLGFSYWYFTRPVQAIDSVAVLPFVNVGGDASMEYLSDGLTESLINSLSQLPNLKIIARSSVFRYKGKEVDPQVVGRELGVRAVLTGRVVQLGDSLSIQTELVDVATQTRLWGENYTRKVSDIISLQDEISREISDKLRLKLTGEEKKHLAKRYTDNSEAYQLYWKGRYYWNKRRPEDIREAIRYFQQAIELDRNYALAYTGLADCYVLGNLLQMSPKEAMPIAIEKTNTALAIDPELAEAHTSLAKIKLSYEWEWAGAESEFKKALEHKPGYATAHQWFGVYLSEMGRHDESLEHRKRALELDPLSLSISTGVGRAYFWARRYDEGLEHLRQTLERDPKYADTHWSLGLNYEGKQMYAEAVSAYQRAISLSKTAEFPEGKPEMIAALGHAYAVSGRKSEALKIIEQLKELINRQSYVSPYSVALIYTGLEEEDRAFEWLDRAYNERDESFIHLKVDPRLDGLRSDQRFTERLQLIKLAP
ncbi:MAG: eukaryotic-like serine/threonine-protein kinase [Acidobacteriota bacterium]|jgi:serine/threonine-protein kinase|nr:eukaryotic-like serine/threonine-protein kinase [Acidobacteriota bacterium]